MISRLKYSDYWVKELEKTLKKVVFVAMNHSDSTLYENIIFSSWKITVQTFIKEVDASLFVRLSEVSDNELVNYLEKSLISFQKWDESICLVLKKLDIIKT